MNSTLFLYEIVYVVYMYMLLSIINIILRNIVLCVLHHVRQVLSQGTSHFAGIRCIRMYFLFLSYVHLIFLFLHFVPTAVTPLHHMPSGML